MNTYKYGVNYCRENEIHYPLDKCINVVHPSITPCTCVTACHWSYRYSNRQCKTSSCVYWCPASRKLSLFVMCSLQTLRVKTTNAIFTMFFISVSFVFVYSIPIFLVDLFYYGKEVLLSKIFVLLRVIFIVPFIMSKYN